MFITEPLGETAVTHPTLFLGPWEYESQGLRPLVPQSTPLPLLPKGALHQLA